MCKKKSTSQRISWKRWFQVLYESWLHPPVTTRNIPLDRSLSKPIGLRKTSLKSQVILINSYLLRGDVVSCHAQFCKHCKSSEIHLRLINIIDHHLELSIILILFTGHALIRGPIRHTRAYFTRLSDVFRAVWCSVFMTIPSRP